MRDKSQYEGAKRSTLCIGCGHDQISRYLVEACYQAQLPPFRLIKVSGIGCSSKTADYFFKASQGFNTLHGRMAAVATGVKIANKDLKVIGISGDGDTASIGLQGFLHTIKKNIPMLYIVENNGVYGLTKGQSSVTAKNFDLASLAFAAGAGFIARAYSGDGKGLVSILKQAVNYQGFAFIDIISPCVVYGKDPYTHTYKAQLPKSDHDPSSKEQALKVLCSKDLFTGVIYHLAKKTFFDNENLVSEPLNSIQECEARLSIENLEKVLQLFK